MHYSTELLEAKNREEKCHKTDEDSCVPQFWKRAQNGTDLLSDGGACFDTSQRPYYSKYSKRLQIYFNSNYFEDTII